MGRRRDKRNGPAMRKIASSGNQELVNYEGDDEGRDEESLPPSPGEPIAAAAAVVEAKEEPKTKSKKKKPKKDEEFEVEEIVGMEVNTRWRCAVRFRVRWVGYGEKEDTWVSDDNLSCSNFVQEFLQISGRKAEYERALESKRPESLESTYAAIDGYKSALRTRYQVDYEMSESDEDAVMHSTTTRTRQTRAPELFNPSDARPQLLKTPAKPFVVVVNAGVSREEAIKQQAGREYEVVMIVDHRVRGRFTEYKVRWKGLNSSQDSWVAEANLNCTKLIANYRKNITDEPEPSYEVSAIIDSREEHGQILYKVRWKGFSEKFDSWLPRDEMNCPGIVDKFEAALDKLNKKQDWVVRKIKLQRVRHNTTEYLVSWDGFDTKFDTWEPEANLQGCKDKLEIFAARQASQKKRKQSSAGEESDQDGHKDEEEEKEVKQEKEEKQPKPSKSKKKKRESLPTKASASSDSRRRRLTLPVSYEEDNDGSDE